MDKEKEHEYVTNGKLNKIIYEVKNEIRDIDIKHERLYVELKNSIDSSNQTMVNLNENIKSQTEMMGEMVNDSKIMRAEIIDMQKDNISRDHKLEDLDDFKRETSDNMSKKNKEIWTFFGVIAVGIFGIVQAAISVSHYFF